MPSVATGILLLVLAAALAGVGWARLLDRQPPLRRLVPAQRTMSIATSNVGDYHGDVSLPGLIESPPSLTAPASGRPCAVWLAGLIETDRHQTLWATGSAGEVVVSYQQRSDTFYDQHRKRNRYRTTHKGGGTVSIPAGRIRVVPAGELPDLGLARFGAGFTFVPVDVAALEPLGLPADLTARVRAEPDRFAALEGIATTGDVLGLGQRPETPPAVLPDPGQPFDLRSFPPPGDIRVYGPGRSAYLAVFAGFALAGAGIYLLTC